MISCALHDYIEIACLYGYPVELLLRDGSSHQGNAKTTRTGDNRREYLVIDQGADGLREIDLESLQQMRALSPNPHFDKVDF